VAGSWSFDPLARELRARGHEVEAPDLPCEDVSAGVAEYAALVGPQPDAIVVGHSLAGLTLPLVEARRVVFLSALVPMEDVFGEALDPRFTGYPRDELDRSYRDDEAMAAELLWPDVAPETARAAFPRPRRQARLEPVPALPEGARSYVATTRDVCVRPEWQRRAASALLGVEPLELDAGHLAPLTHPVELAGLLESLE